MNIKATVLAAFGGVGALIMCSSVQATYTGLSAEGQTLTIHGDLCTVWRLYANFTNPSEGVYAIGPLGTAMTLNVMDTNGVVGGGGVIFRAGAAPTPPTQGDIDNNPSTQYRSFYTIGISVQDQNPNPALYPLTNVNMPQINGNTVTAVADSGMTSTTPDAPFAMANWSGQNRVLILRLQVTGGAHVKGTIGLNLVGSGGVIVATFNSLPAPGALTLLGLAALFGSFRRRARDSKEIAP